MKAKAKPKKKRRVVLGVGQPLIERRTLKLLRADFIKSAAEVYLRARGLGPWNKVRLVAEVLK